MSMSHTRSSVSTGSVFTKRHLGGERGRGGGGELRKPRVAKLRVGVCRSSLETLGAPTRGAALDQGCVHLHRRRHMNQCVVTMESGSPTWRE